MYLTNVLLTLVLAFSPSTDALVIDSQDTVSFAGVSSVYTVPDSPQATNAARFTINNNNGISSGIPNNALPDPCGPSQLRALPGEKTFSTCHQNVSVSTLDKSKYYGVQCQNDNTGYKLNQTTCQNAMATICAQMSGMQLPNYQVSNKWIWSTYEHNCTFGYWLPWGGAPAPSFERCYEQIFAPMYESCMVENELGARWNVGSVNLKELPLGEGTGTAVDADYPSYVMVAEGSYWGVNAEDAAVVNECKPDSGAVYDCAVIEGG